MRSDRTGQGLREAYCPRCERPRSFLISMGHAHCQFCGLACNAKRLPDDTEHYEHMRISTTPPKDVSGTVTRAIFDDDRRIVKYVIRTDDGTEIGAVMGNRRGDTVISDAAMRQIADQLPGTSVDELRDYHD